MKRYLFLLLLVIELMQNGLAQTANSSAPFVSPQAKQIYLNTHSNLPLERYEVAYYTTDATGGSLSPAYIDVVSKTAYRWTGVMLQPDQIPMYFTQHPNGGSGLIFPHDPSQSSLQFKDIDPPVFYMLLPDGKYAKGYLDDGHEIYYRWGDLEFDKSQLPADAASKNRILPLHAAQSSTIPPPSNDSRKSHGATTQTPSNEQTSSTPDLTAPASTPHPTPMQTPKPLAEVAPVNDTRVPLWLYAIIVFSVAAIISAGYHLSKRGGKGP